MVEWWVIAALLAMLANLAKVLMVKRYCHQIDAWWLVFYSRLIPGAILLIALQFISYQIIEPMVFWSATLLAALLTIGGSLLYINALKQGELSRVMPVQASVPLFMVITTWLLYDEVPGLFALSCMVMIVFSVGYVLRANGQRGHSQGSHHASATYWSLLAALLFGISTVLDRVAIAAATHGALVFSAYWSLVTVVLLLPMLGWRWRTSSQPTRKQLFAFPLWVYMLLVLLAFISQQFAVEWSLHVENGVSYVKTIVMIHIAAAAWLGIKLLGERPALGVVIANGMAALSAIGLLWSI